MSSLDKSSGLAWRESLLRLSKRFSKTNELSSFSLILSSWKDIINDEALYRETKVLKIREQVLFVSCSSSAVRSLCEFKKSTILSAIRALLLKNEVKDVKFVIR